MSQAPGRGSLVAACGHHPPAVPGNYADRDLLLAMDCHVLAADGHGDYWDQLGLSWGCRWRGSGVLFGSMDWPSRTAPGVRRAVSIRTFAHVDEARNESSV